MRLRGRVGNDVGGVRIDVEGTEADLAAFVVALREEAPRLAEIDQLAVRRRFPTHPEGFQIVRSDSGDPRDPRDPRDSGGAAAAVRAQVCADSATCDDCLTELADPADRRYGYPFINCTNCGPRFTIVQDVPYDRPLTTMARFEMCADCAAEYHDPTDRRFHAQPVCCPACGPALRLWPAQGPPADPLDGAAELLRAGRILAVKGLGGYHLAVLAAAETAAATLRARKHREDKPFAVMVPDLATAEALCLLDDTARRLLAGRRRPILLAERRGGPGAPHIARAVAPGAPELGLMLPYTPLHHLLLARLPGPIVLTSGNVSDEPIAYRDGDAFAALGGIADAFLTHDRAIHTRVDDSVSRVWRGRETVVRRSRGYAPEPVGVPWEFPRAVLACGAELKNTFCLAADSRVHLSGHIGDLENYETLSAFTHGIDQLQRLFDIRPQILAHDLHPEYLSTKYAVDRADAETDPPELVGVQHHHAHIASCLADNRHPGPVIGVAFDGLGHGLDGTLWGGEFLVADLAGFTRAAHLTAVPMPGGTAAIRAPWRMAAAYLTAAGIDEDAADLAVARRNSDRWDGVVGLARAAGTPRTSSVGRLFDAVAALLGIRDTISYEGQAAIELERAAAAGDHGDHGWYGWYGGGMVRAGAEIVDGVAIVRAVVDDLRRGVDAALIAARFHHTLARLTVEECIRLRERTGLATAALSGGVFANRRLLAQTVDGLAAAGFTVLTHSRVPCNDGGISLGQAVVAGVGRRMARSHAYQSSSPSPETADTASSGAVGFTWPAAAANRAPSKSR